MFAIHIFLSCPPFVWMIYIFIHSSRRESSRHAVNTTCHWFLTAPAQCGNRSVTWPATLFVSACDTKWLRDLSPPSPPRAPDWQDTGRDSPITPSDTSLEIVLNAQIETCCSFSQHMTSRFKKQNKNRPPFIREQRQAEIAAGSGPDGNVWPPSRDGRKRLHK